MRRIPKLLIFFMLAMVLVLSACSKTQVEGDIDDVQDDVPVEEAVPVDADKSGLDGITEETMPMLDGSTANLPLMAHLYAKVTGVTYEEAQTMVRASKTNEAWRLLVEGGPGTLLLVYEPSSELKAEFGKGIDKLEITPIGYDALVFLTGKDNPVDSLTSQQIQSIYSGEIGNWSAVGGEDLEIAALQRNEGSGSQTLMQTLLMKDIEMAEPPMEYIVGSMEGLISSLAGFGNFESRQVIGYSVYYYAKEMNSNPDLKMLAVDGATPSNETIADGSYELRNEFYVVIRGDEPEGSPARIIRDWLLTAEGKQLVDDAGYVGVTKP